MPSPLASSFFIFAVVLTTLSPSTAVAFAAVGLLIEGARFYLSGSDGLG